MRKLAAAGAGWIVVLAGLAAAGQTPQAKAPAAREELRKFARDLGDPAFGTRELATRRLIEAGSAAVEPVAEAAETSDVEVVNRAVRVLKKLAQGNDAAAKRAAIRALQRLSESPYPAAKNEAIRVRGTVLSHLKRIESLGGVLGFDDDAEVVRAEIVGGRFTDRDTFLLLQLPRLRELAFRDSNLSDNGVRPLRTMPGLERLEFKSCGNLTDLALSNLAQLTNLREVRFSDCRHLTGAGLRHLSGLPKLDTLALARGQATEEGLRHLQRLARLEKLSLADTDLGDAGLGLLEKLPGLRELNLSGTRVSKEGIERLQKALPQCQVAH